MGQSARKVSLAFGAERHPLFLFLERRLRRWEREKEGERGDPKKQSRRGNGPSGWWGWFAV